MGLINWFNLFIQNFFVDLSFLLILLLICINGFFFFYSRFRLSNILSNWCYILNILIYLYFFISSLHIFVYFNFSQNLFISTYSDLLLPVSDKINQVYAITFISDCLGSYSNLFFFNLFQSLSYIDAPSILFIILLAFLSVTCTVTHVYQNLQLILMKVIHHNSSNIHIANSINSKGDLIKTDIDLFSNRNFSFLLKLAFMYLSSFVFFSTDNLLILYISFEASMLPLFFMIGNFGSRVNKIKAAYLLFFFTLGGSVFFLAALTILYNYTGSFNIFYLIKFPFSIYIEKLIWFLLFIPFATKVPIVPVHIWLPEAHVEASTEGSVLLAGIMLKLGLLAIVKFLLPIWPHASVFFTPMVYTLALISIIFISFNIFLQLDLKKIIAYSSIIHMNYALLGIFSKSVLGLHGAIYLMFTHGIISSGLFVVIGFLYSRFHTRLLSYYQGLCSAFPTLSSIFFILLLGNAAIPGTGGFVGEILIFFAIFDSNFIVALFSLFAPLSGAIVSIILFVRIFFGSGNIAILNKFTTLNNSFSDKLNTVHVVTYPLISSEYSVLVSYIFFTIHTGIFSSMYLARLEPSVIFYLSAFN